MVDVQQIIGRLMRIIKFDHTVAYPKFDFKATRWLSGDRVGLYLNREASNGIRLSMPPGCA